MNVEELIEKLKTFDEDLEVCYTDSEYGFEDIKTVKESTRVIYKNDEVPGDRIVFVNNWM